jgi:hypothetical protein
MVCLRKIRMRARSTMACRFSFNCCIPKTLKMKIFPSHLLSSTFEVH